MSNTAYHFSKEQDGWIIYHGFGGDNHRITKELMKEKLYDAFQAVLGPDSIKAIDNCRAKLPAYLQFEGCSVNTPMGSVDVTIELYIRKHTIESVNMIISGTQGTVARKPTDRFVLQLPDLALTSPISDEEEVNYDTLSSDSIVKQPDTWVGSNSVQ